MKSKIQKILILLATVVLQMTALGAVVAAVDSEIFFVLTQIAAFFYGYFYIGPKFGEIINEHHT